MSPRIHIYRSRYKDRTRFEVRYRWKGRIHREKYPTKKHAVIRKEALEGKFNRGTMFLDALPPEKGWEYLQCDKIAQQFGVTALQLCQEARQTRLGKPDAHLKAPNVQEVFTQFLADKAGQGLSTRHLEDYKGRIGRFAADFNVRINEITGPDIAAWLRGLAVAPRTRNNYRSAVRDLFTFAKENKWLPKDWDELAAVKPAKTRPRKEIYTPEEMRLLVEGAGDKLLPTIVCAGFEGLRTESEIRPRSGRPGLQWEDFDWDNRVIHIYPHSNKTGDPRLIPIHDVTMEFLKPWRDKRGPVCPYAVLKGAFNRLARKVGLKWKHNALRHSYGTYRVAMTQNLEQVALEMGNSRAELLKSYFRPRLKKTAEEWFGIRPQTVTTGILKLQFR